MIKSFFRDGLSYVLINRYFDFSDWRCDYPDHTSAVVRVYGKKPTRQNVIDAINSLKVQECHSKVFLDVD